MHPSSTAIQIPRTSFPPSPPFFSVSRNPNDPSFAEDSASYFTFLNSYLPGSHWAQLFRPRPLVCVLLNEYVLPPQLLAFWGLLFSWCPGWFSCAIVSPGSSKALFSPMRVLLTLSSLHPAPGLYSGAFFSHYEFGLMRTVPNFAFFCMIYRITISNDTFFPCLRDPVSCPFFFLPLFDSLLVFFLRLDSGFAKHFTILPLRSCSPLLLYFSYPSEVAFFWSGPIQTTPNPPETGIPFYTFSRS